MKESRAPLALLSLALALFAALAAMSCAKGQILVPIPPCEETIPTMRCVQTIFDRYGCGKSGCHDGATEPFCNPLDLRTAAASYASLVTGSPQGCAFCWGWTMVVPGDSAASCFPFTVDPNNFYMPFDGPPYLSAEELQLIRDWIDAGALFE